jgi:Thioredoxin like C-terminal domain
MSVFERLHMPSLGGATEWLNSEPLDPAELRRHAVLVNFWTLSHGVDVDADGNGSLRAGRLYHLAREHDAVSQRTLEITFLEPGVEAHVITFG